MSDDYTFDAVVERETPEALLLDVGLDDPVWFPKSQCDDNGDGTFTVPQWIAEDKGIV